MSESLNTPRKEHVSDDDVDDDDEQGFTYPEADDAPPEHALNVVAPDSEEEEFTYPADNPESPSATRPEPGPSSTSPHSEPLEQVEVQPKPVKHAPTAQLDALYTAGLNGNLSVLKKLVAEATSSSQIESFAFVNDASPRTGLTVLHAAASRGHLEAVKWCK